MVSSEKHWGTCTYRFRSDVRDVLVHHTEMRVRKMMPLMHDFDGDFYMSHDGLMELLFYAGILSHHPDFLQNNILCHALSVRHRPEHSEDFDSRQMRRCSAQMQREVVYELPLVGLPPNEMLKWPHYLSEMLKRENAEINQQVTAEEIDNLSYEWIRIFFCW
jgi:hypothetical protein